MAKVADQMVCVNCDEVFPRGKTCPACASRHVYPLCKWLAVMPDMIPTVNINETIPECAEMVATWVR